MSLSQKTQWKSLLPCPQACLTQCKYVPTHLVVKVFACQDHLSAEVIPKSTPTYGRLLEELHIKNHISPLSQHIRKREVRAALESAVRPCWRRWAGLDVTGGRRLGRGTGDVLRTSSDVWVWEFKGFLLVNHIKLTLLHTYWKQCWDRCDSHQHAVPALHFVLFGPLHGQVISAVHVQP